MTNKKPTNEPKATTEPKGFWEKILGPDREVVWKELSEQINSRIERGGFLASDKMLLDVGNWTITLDEYTVSNGKTSQTFSRMRAPFKANSSFSFCITPHNLFSNIAIKLFGAQDIQVHDEAFDKRFVIEGNNEWKVRELLSSEKIRQLLLNQDVGVQFALKDDGGWFGTKFPDGVDELYFSTAGTVRDVKVLRIMFDLFTETLVQLKRMDVASTENPGVKY